MNREAPNKSVCIFDFDGTLVDSMDSFADLAAKLMAQVYSTSEEDARKDYIKTSGLPFAEQLEVLYPADPRNPKVAQVFERRKIEKYWSAQFFEDVPKTLKKLQARGVRTVVSSNNGQEVVQQYIEKNDAQACFDLVLGFKPGFSKGADHFQLVLDHFEVKPEEVIFVGDSLHDARKAEGFGLDFVGRLGTFTRNSFLEDFPQADLVEDFSQLPEVVCKSSS